MKLHDVVLVLEILVMALELVKDLPEIDPITLLFILSMFIVVYSCSRK